MPVEREEVILERAFVVHCLLLRSIIILRLRFTTHSHDLDTYLSSLVLSTAVTVFSLSSFELILVYVFFLTA